MIFESIDVVVPTFNREEVLCETLERLNAGANYVSSVVIVNAGSPISLPKFPYRVEVLNVPDSWFWAKCLDFGVRHVARAGVNRLVLSLNDDAFLDERFADVILASVSELDFGMLLNVVERDQGGYGIYFGGGAYDFFGRQKCNFSQYSMLPSNRCAHIDSEIFYGRGLFFQSDDYIGVGGMAYDIFPQYFADEDFALRLTRHGKVGAVILDSTVIVNETLASKYVSRKERGFSLFVRSIFSVHSPNNLKQNLLFGKRNFRSGVFGGLLRFLSIIKNY